MRATVPRRGATKVEYALLLLLISVGCLLAVGSLGRGVSGLFSGATVPLPADHVPADTDPPGTGTAMADPPDPPPGGGKKLKKARPNRGQPGQGNAGNDKPVGNAPANAGSK